MEAFLCHPPALGIRMEGMQTLSPAQQQHSTYSEGPPSPQLRCAAVPFFGHPDYQTRWFDFLLISILLVFFFFCFLKVVESLPYNEKVDVYAFGLLLWEMLEDRRVFDGMGVTDFYERVVNAGARPNLDPSWPTVRGHTSTMKAMTLADGRYIFALWFSCSCTEMMYRYMTSLHSVLSLCF